MFGKITKVHLIGIGGSGMCGIAEVLINRGFKVTGSDLAENVAVKRLKSLGAVVHLGHAAENLGDAQVVVVSSAIDLENPEVRLAHEKMIPVIPRAEMLMELMRMKNGIAVAGAHGKTTTTTFVLSVLAAGGLDPTAVIGGRVNAIGSNVKLGQGDLFIVEADESDGSFLHLTPTIAVITNIDREHMNHYREMQHLRKAFVDFANCVPFYGTSIVCLDDAEVQLLMPHLRRRFITFGLHPEAQVCGEVKGRESGTTQVSIQVKLAGRVENLGEVSVHVPGLHNVRNALAAVAVGLECGVSFEKIRMGLEQFSGIERRFQIKGEKNGVLIIDDYAHHPKEIEATLSACREAYSGKRLVVVFQPHRYSRLQDLFERFQTCFQQADRLLLLPVYPAGERPLAGYDSAHLATAIARQGKIQVAGFIDKKAVMDELQKNLQKGDLLVTLGAGDVYKLAEEYLK